MPAFAHVATTRSETPKARTPDWYRDWKNRVKADDPDMVAQMAATAIFCAANAWACMCAIAPLAKQQTVLMDKLADPALDASPFRPRAVSTSFALDHEMLRYLGSMAASERNATVIWNDLTPAERTSFGVTDAWEATPTQADLIGQSFVIGRGLDFPPAFSFKRVLQHSWGWPVVTDWATRGIIQ